MAVKLGENLQNEWDSDPNADLVWDAIQLRKVDPEAGLKSLIEHSEQGSTLAMIYLVRELKSDNAQDDVEHWLSEAADKGSLEACFQLAVHYHSKKNGEAAVERYKQAAGKGYAPAMYYLGMLHYHGIFVGRDVATALDYFERAKTKGHIPSMGYLAWIYRKEGFGLKGRLLAHWNCAAKIPSGVWHLIKFPNSDRIRGLSLKRRK